MKSNNICKIESALNKYGINIRDEDGNFLNTCDVLNEIANVLGWDDHVDAQGITDALEKYGVNLGSD